MTYFSNPKFPHYNTGTTIPIFQGCIMIKITHEQCQLPRKTVPNPSSQFSPKLQSYLVDRHSATQHIQNSTFKSFSNCIIPNLLNGIATNLDAPGVHSVFPSTPTSNLSPSSMYFPSKIYPEPASSCLSCSPLHFLL